MCQFVYESRKYDCGHTEQGLSLEKACSSRRDDKCPKRVAIREAENVISCFGECYDCLVGKSGDPVFLPREKVGQNEANDRKFHHGSDAVIFQPHPEVANEDAPNEDAANQDASNQGN